MSEKAEPGIDPRFDPRFQRGYVPDAAPPSRARGTDGRAGDDDAALGELFAHVERGAVDGEATDAVRATDDPTPEARAHDDPAEAGQLAAAAAPAGPEPDPGTGVGAPSTRWFWIALAACLAFIVVGVALFWNGASDRAMFRAAPSGLEGAFNQFSMTLAPGLVQAGVIGVVIVLVMWALTGRRSGRGVG